MPNKPIADWTLGEVKAECERCGGLHHRCEICELYNTCYKCNWEDPYEWDLTDPPRFDADELAFMRMLYKGGARWLARDEVLDGRIRWFERKPMKQGRNLFWFGGLGDGNIPHNLFRQILWTDAEPVEIAKYIEVSE